VNTLDLRRARVRACQRPRARGFTIIEILVVVTILGILATIAILRFAGTKEGATVASMKSDLRNLATAQEEFFSEQQAYAAAVGPTKTTTTAAFGPSEANLLTLSSVSISGWAAEETNPALKGPIVGFTSAVLPLLIRLSASPGRQCAIEAAQRLRDAVLEPTAA